MIQQPAASRLGAGQTNIKLQNKNLWPIKLNRSQIRRTDKDQDGKRKTNCLVDGGENRLISWRELIRKTNLQQPTLYVSASVSVSASASPSASVTAVAGGCSASSQSESQSHMHTEKILTWVQFW